MKDQERNIIQLSSKPISLNQLIEHTPSTSVEAISPESRTNIYKLLAQYHIQMNGIFDLIRYDKLNEISWTTSKEGGSLAKRVSKWYYEYHKKSLPPEILTKIGSITISVDTKKSYYFDITNIVDWENGEFHDSGSCLWGGRKAGKAFLHKSPDFFAIRLFKESEDTPYTREATKNPKQVRYPNLEKKTFYIGAARAWLWKTVIQIEQTRTRIFEAPIYVLFNSYGTQSVQMAKLLADYLGVDYHQVELSNKGDRYGELYLNGDGIIIGPKNLIEEVTFIDFNQTIKSRSSSI